MQDPELRRLWEELDRQRKDLDWILSILSQRAPLRPIKSPHELLERVHDLEQDVAALKRLVSDQSEGRLGPGLPVDAPASGRAPDWPVLGARVVRRASLRMRLSA